MYVLCSARFILMDILHENLCFFKNGLLKLPAPLYLFIHLHFKLRDLSCFLMPIANLLGFTIPKSFKLFGCGSGHLWFPCSKIWKQSFSERYFSWCRSYTLVLIFISFCFFLIPYLVFLVVLWHKLLEKLGENVEPVELEEAAMRSSLIQQIVVVGQVEFQQLSSVLFLFLYWTFQNCSYLYSATFKRPRTDFMHLVAFLYVGSTATWGNNCSKQRRGFTCSQKVVYCRC